jgi:hypothetical protein
MKKDDTKSQFFVLLSKEFKRQTKLLEKAEAFITGFEDDDSQEDLRLLPDLRAGLERAEKLIRKL